MMRRRLAGACAAESGQPARRAASIADGRLEGGQLREVEERLDTGELVGQRVTAAERGVLTSTVGDLRLPAQSLRDDEPHERRVRHRGGHLPALVGDGAEEEIRGEPGAVRVRLRSPGRRLRRRGLRRRGDHQRERGGPSTTVMHRFSVRLIDTGHEASGVTKHAPDAWRSDTTGPGPTPGWPQCHIITTRSVMPRADRRGQRGAPGPSSRRASRSR